MKATLTLPSSGSANTSPPPLDDLTIVPFTDENEQLYRRIAASLARSGRIEAAAFRFQEPKPEEEPSGLSFNRSSMSAPKDVLKGAKLGASVAAVVVRTVPREIVSGSVRFTFQVEHRPIVGNRSHSEIRAYDDAGVFHAYPPHGEIRKLFREHLALVALPID